MLKISFECGRLCNTPLAFSLEILNIFNSTETNGTDVCRTVVVMGYIVDDVAVVRIVRVLCE